MMRVLIVDDEPLARARLTALLGACADVEITGAVGDGEAALGAISALQPDVVLLDINMPGTDGMALAQRLLGRARPQVIFCTAYETHALEAFELDAIDYLLKPVRLERLREALARAQRRNLVNDRVRHTRPPRCGPKRLPARNGGTPTPATRRRFTCTDDWVANRCASRWTR